MKDVMRFAGTIIFYIFVGVVLLWTASLTLRMMQTVLPEDPITPWFALALFDGGAVTWLLTFVGHARGLGQRAIALLMLVLDIIGVVLLSGAELFLGGQSIAAIPENLGTYVVWATAIWTALNLIAAYAFHIMDPAVSNLIELQTSKDHVEREAMDQAKSYLVEKTPELAEFIANRLILQAKADMRLLDRKSSVIDAKIREPKKSDPT